MKVTETNNQRPTERIDMRISKENKEIVERASKIAGYTTTSSFILTTILKYSKEIIRNDEIFQKSLKANKEFIESMSKEELDLFISEFDNYEEKQE